MSVSGAGDGDISAGDVLYGAKMIYAIQTKTEQGTWDDSWHEESHQIVNGSVGFEKGIWELTLWGHNLLDELYAVRGFYFGLTPPDYADTLYVSYGDPRQVGLSLGARF